MKLSSATALGFITGCVPSAVAVDVKPPHHATDGFCNYPPAPRPETPSFSFIFRRIRESDKKPEIPKGHVLGESVAMTDFNRRSGSDSLTWIGHTTYLLRLENKILLTDPFFGDVASPLPIGPERYVKPAISLKNLPPIDALVVSHNHYDHLDSEAVENLPGKERIAVFVPLGLKAFFTKRGYGRVIELDWHQTTEFEGVRLTALPAVHFSSRGLGDRNETLWCSWAIRSRSHSCFFAGDTAYSPTIFKDIGKHFRGFDSAIVPIGAYEPIKVMKPVHVNPEEAIQIANDVKADLIIPSHWGTIVLTDEPPFEPPERYRKFAVRNGIGDGRASTLKIGETRAL
ncbi:MAG: hydrolase [Proteobacteria bacterium]|nr:hydrolase [Pseudomonadota bacterium]